MRTHQATSSQHNETSHHRQRPRVSIRYSTTILRKSGHNSQILNPVRTARKRNRRETKLHTHGSSSRGAKAQPTPQHLLGGHRPGCSVQIQPHTTSHNLAAPVHNVDRQTSEHHTPILFRPTRPRTSPQHQNKAPTPRIPRTVHVRYRHGKHHGPKYNHRSIHKAPRDRLPPLQRQVRPRTHESKRLQIAHTTQRPNNNIRNHPTAKIP